MEEWKNFINKHIKIFYDDGNNFPSKKEGILTGVTNTHLILKIFERGEQAILLSRIIRAEVIENG